MPNVVLTASSSEGRVYEQWAGALVGITFTVETSLTHITANRFAISSRDGRIAIATLFDVAEIDGVWTLKLNDNASLDYEALTDTSIDLRIKFFDDLDDLSNFGQANVSVSVIDVVGVPIIADDVLTATLVATADVGVEVAQIDSPLYESTTLLRWRIASGNDEGHFAVDVGEPISLMTALNNVAATHILLAEAAGADGTDSTTLTITTLATFALAAIYEHHPTDKAIATIEVPADLQTAQFALASTGTNDNALFRLDAGKLYWKAAPDFESPQDADGDNRYDIDIIFTKSDGTKHLRKHTLNVQDIGPGRYGYDATAAPDGGFGSYTLSYDSVPQEERPDGLVNYIIDGSVKVMPDAGPLIFTWSLHANSIYTAAEVRVYLDEAFDAFEDAANLKFIEVASDSDIVINFQSRTSDIFGEAHPYITPLAINYYLLSEQEFSGFYRTLTHEIGHTLGLKHPFEPSNANTLWLSNPNYINNANTMMSYALVFIARDTPLLPIDVAALQFLYGAPGDDGARSAERFLKFEANRDYIHAVAERSLDWHPARLVEISDALSIGAVFYNVLHADTLSQLQSLTFRHYEYKSSTYSIDSTHGDAAFFEISESGAISLKQNLDADTPQDSYGKKPYVKNNVYEIKIDAVHTYERFGVTHRGEDFGYLGIEVVSGADIGVNPLMLTPSATSTTINENSAGAVSDIILTATLDGVAITTLTADNFDITGNGATQFEVGFDSGAWKLKLIDNVILDAEATNSISLNITVSQDGRTSTAQTLTVNVGNVDEGRETPYFIDNTGGVREAPQPGTILTAKRSANQNRQDPDGHDDSVADIFKWFHESDRNTVIGTGETYTVKTSDVGAQLRFRVTYRDLSGTDEVVLANEGSISGVVTLDGTARIALVASATTASIDEDTDGASTDIEFSVYDGAEYAFTSTDFTITGAESEHFEIARNQAGNWHLRLIDEHSLNYESITSLNLQVRVSDGTQQSNTTENIAISVTNQDDGDASIAINGADVEVGTRLSITFTPDPDGLMTGTTYTYDWFYARDPDTAIDTGVSYTIAEKDRGEYIGVKVTYTDTLGTQVVQHISDEPVPYVVITPDTPVKEDNTIQAEQDKASKVDAGDGADSIKDGKRNDVIIGGLGDDVIDLGGDSDGTDTDQVIYRIGEQTAADGGDRITNFNRGKDQFTFSLESNAATDAIEDYEGFLNYVNSGTPGVVKDDQFLVLLDIDYFAPILTLEGLYLHFKDSSFFSDGRISMPLVNIKFAEGLTGDEFLKVFGENVDISDVIDVNGLLRDLSYLDDLLGGDGSVGFEII